MAASKVNVGSRSPEKDAEAKAALAADAKASGANIVTEGGSTFAVSKVMGLTIKTRIG